MLQLEWNNPRITLGDLEIYLSNYLGSLYDGMVIEGAALRIMTTSVLSTEQEDYIKNYFYTVNNKPMVMTLDAAKDSDGSLISRTKIAPAGWHYQLHCVEVSTSVLNGFVNDKYDGTSYGFVTHKCYNAAGTLLTNQLNIDTECVKTVVDWEPTFDYELIGGSIYQDTVPISNVRFWIVAVPDLPVSYGGSVVFGSGINLKYVNIAGTVSMDGRSPKRLTYSATYHSNKLRLIFKHNAGYKHEGMFLFELFKVNS